MLYGYGRWLRFGMCQHCKSVHCLLACSSWAQIMTHCPKRQRKRPPMDPDTPVPSIMQYPDWRQARSVQPTKVCIALLVVTREILVLRAAAIHGRMRSSGPGLLHECEESSHHLANIPAFSGCSSRLYLGLPNGGSRSKNLKDVLINEPECRSELSVQRHLASGSRLWYALGP